MNQFNVPSGRKIKILNVLRKQAVQLVWTVINAMDGNKNSIILLFIVRQKRITQKKI